VAPSNVSQSLLLALKEHGAREVFGIPGDFVLPFFKVVEESGIMPLYTFSHEPAVGFAADAAARWRCAPSVAAATWGAGALNMVNAVAGAFAEKSPVVVVSGAPGRSEGSRGLLLHHQVKTLDSQYRIYAEITCDQARLDDPLRAPADIARVLRSCVTHSQPVYIEIPRDAATAACEPVVAEPVRTFDREALAACADEIIARLAGAASPVMMVGVEVRRFGLENKVAALAKRLGIPVVTSVLGRGLLANSDVPLLGTYLGVAGAAEITDLVEESDALFLVGEIVSDVSFGVSSRRIDLRKTIQALDERVTLGYHTYPHIPLDSLVDALLACDFPARCPLPVAPAVYPRGLPEDDARIGPNDIACAVNDLMAGTRRFPIAADMGDCLFTAMDIDNTSLVAPAYYASMGFGVPAGMGLQAACGERPLILVGDGAFQMTGAELANCARYGWDPIVIVFNNASWEMLRAFQPESRFNDLPSLCFGDLAAGLGGDGVRVRTRRELRAALVKAAATRRRFQLIDVSLERGALSSTLERFVRGMKRPAPVSSARS